MPLTINVGLSRKASKDYQSSGTSINITAELDQALLQHPDELQARIDELYQQAERAVERRTTDPAEPPAPSGGRQPRQNGRARGNGQNAAPAATQAQKRAIDAIGRRLGLDTAAEVRAVFGCELDRLTVQEASQVIDHLKGLAQPARKGGAR